MKVTIERSLQALQVLAIVFVMIYLLTYVAHQRAVSDCQTNTNAALITSVSAARDAARIESNGMNTLISGLLSDHPDARDLLQAYQTARAQADNIRVDNPLPNPAC
jgi:hypothetical protein